MYLSRRSLAISLILQCLHPILSIRSRAEDTFNDHEIYYDDNGLIVHKNNDGGDTAQREGWYWLGVWIRANILNTPWEHKRKLAFAEVMDLLEPERDGVFYRHPKLPPWNNPYDKRYGFSRDQMIPLVAAMGVWGDTNRLRRLWNALPQDPIGGTKHTFNGEWVTILGKRTIFTGDIVALSTTNLFRRAWNENPMHASDGNGLNGERELLVNSLSKVPPALTDRDSTGDDLNHIVSLILAILRFPSSISKEAVDVYSKNRLVSYGSFRKAYYDAYKIDPFSVPLNQSLRQELDSGIRDGHWNTDTSRIYGAIAWYHRASTGANPFLAELYRPIVSHWFE